jgi:hypothetical protein
MGIEAFSLRIVGIDHAAALVFMKQRLGFRDSRVQPRSQLEWLVDYEDNSHLIESEIRSSKDQDQISLRFALCQPSTIDALLIGITTHIVAQLGGKVHISGSSHSGPFEWFSAPTVLECSSVMLQERGVWQAMYGTSTVKLSCAEALEHFVMRQ